MQAFPEAGEDSLVAFIHIPKTAGTTLNSILDHHYSRNEIYEVMMRGMSLRMPRPVTMPRPAISFSKIRRLKSALKHQHALRVIHGHFDLSLGTLLPANARFITLLRDPVERAISHYYHYRKITTDPIHPLALRLTLAEWVSTCGLVEMDNGQVRRLAGEMNLPCGQVTSRTLDRAKANLVKFAVVGLTERFEESQILLHRTFNWPLYRYPARNTGDYCLRRVGLNEEELKTIEACNRFDMELYRFASELFHQAVSKIDMANELALLRVAPEYIEPVRTTIAPVHSMPIYYCAPSRLMSMLGRSISIVRSLHMTRKFIEKRLCKKLSNHALEAGKGVILSGLKLYYAAMEKNTPVWAQGVAFSALAYFISPVDAIIDNIPGIGYLDDAVVLATAIAILSTYITAEVTRQAETKLKHWFSRSDPTHQVE